MSPRSQNILAKLECPSRVWAVAAIHGQVERLADLHGVLETRIARGDRIVYLGNYLGHGEAVIETLDELLSFRHSFLTIPGMEPQDIVYLRGAQEEMWRKLLQIQLAGAPAEVFDWMIGQGVGSTLRAYGGNPDAAYARFREGVLSTTKWTGQLREQVKARPGHDQLLASLHRAAYSEGGELLLVHAGIDPHRPLSEQGDAFWWGSGYFAEIVEPFQGFRRVIRGYDRDHSGVQFGPVTASIDGGCGFSGPLNAVCFDLTGRITDRVEV